MVPSRTAARFRKGLRKDHRRDPALGANNRLRAAEAAGLSCPECGHDGLKAEHYLKQWPRRLAGGLLILLTAICWAFASVTSQPGLIMLGLGVAVVGWHAVGRELGTRTLAVCPDCDAGHPL